MHNDSGLRPSRRVGSTPRGKTPLSLRVRVLLGLVVALSLVSVMSAFAASVEPTLLPGAANTDKTCALVMPGTTELKIEPVPDGSYLASDGLLTVSIVKPSTLAGSLNSFDWTSNVLVEGVIVKNGVDGANWYNYSPAGSMGDTYLTTPSYGNKEISHISFCYYPRLTAAKTAVTEYTRTYSWTIDKSVDPAAHVGFAGDSFVSDYEVTVDLTVVDSDFRVTGEITINNPTPFEVGFEVTDSVNGTAAVVDCDPETAGNQASGTLPAGGSDVCTYVAELGDELPADGTNTATVTSLNPSVLGAVATEDYAFGDPTTVEGYAKINVTDYFDGDLVGDPLGSATDDFTFEYDRSFACPTDEAWYEDGVYTDSFPNTAEIDETEDSADANVDLTCYLIDVTKDADTSLTRTWEWDIEKTGDQTELTLSVGQQFPVNYTVTVSAIFEDTDHAVSGNIWVYNPAPMAATINDVSDVISPDIDATVDCGVTFPYSLAAGDTLQCTYEADLPDAEARTNTATATLQNFAYDSEGIGTPSGTTDFSGTADVDFSDATVTEIDECIDVSDSIYGDLGTVCAADLDEETYDFELKYSLYVGPYDVCGQYEFTNCADFVTNDTGTTGQACHTVTVDVPCEGCTLTPGYWKTHSEFGPAPYDDTWAMLPNGASTPFFLSGQTYHQVLWTPPQGGNAYYILAHAYIAAELNLLNGSSSTPEVDAALAQAETWFSTYTPAQVAALKGKAGNDLRAQMIAKAYLLDQYNNGYIGPGHCSEDPSNFIVYLGSGLGGSQVEAAFLPLVLYRR
ncbi:MAG: hypothetical protein HPY83_09255 [Anaerolineae bacterium]|nr:hypothetical protein [Anaerolineae bacterium]